MFKHILLPVDGSAPSSHAINLAIDIARQHGAKVFALHVLEPLPGVAYFTEKIMASQETYTDANMKRAEQYLDEVRDQAQAAGVTCETGIEVDSRPYLAIVGIAKKHGCDLIVLGSHGRSGLNRLLLGSQTQQVLLCSPVPVLVCR